MPPPPMNQSITWVYTQDLESTCLFYSEKLGLTPVHDQRTCRLFRWGPSGFIGVCQVRPGRHVEPKGVVITCVTADVPGWYQHLIARGVTPEGPPERHDNATILAFFVRDPNGYLLEFQTFLDPVWNVVSA